MTHTVDTPDTLSFLPPLVTHQDRWKKDTDVQRLHWTPDPTPVGQHVCSFDSGPHKATAVSIPDRPTGGSRPEGETQTSTVPTDFEVSGSLTHTSLSGTGMGPSTFGHPGMYQRASTPGT